MKHLDQQELADILKVPRSTLACWENNIRTPKISQIVKIADFFKVNLNIIYSDFEELIKKNKNNYNDLMTLLEKSFTLLTQEDINNIELIINNRLENKNKE